MQTLSPERIEALQRNWARLLGSFGASNASAYPIFDDLVERYGEAHRHYHNLEHIDDVLRVIGKLTDLAERPEIIRLAAWFHDAIYDPKAKDNEDRSAQLMIDALGPLGAPPATLAAAAAMIRATAHADAETADADAAVLLDADLAILGAEEKRYRRYAEGIRNEYSWVDDISYRAGRAKVLESFLKRERIYRTERLFAMGEESARRNLLQELESLRNEDLGRA
jgi:predicted metal-dependent HD superfamily phosphohydrolase